MNSIFDCDEQGPGGTLITGAGSLCDVKILATTENRSFYESLAVSWSPQIVRTTHYLARTNLSYLVIDGAVFLDTFYPNVFLASTSARSVFEFIHKKKSAEQYSGAQICIAINADELSGYFSTFEV